MKRVKYILLIALVSASVSAYSQTTNKDEMVKKIFTVLKNKDEDGFVKLFPDGNTMRSFVKKLFGGEGDTSAAFMEMFMEKISDEKLDKEYRKEFKDFIEKGEEKGVEWTKATLVSFTADSIMQEEDEMKMGKLTGKIYFNVDKKEYFLAYTEVIWFDQKGWYGVDIERIDEKSKESQMEISELLQLDSTVSVELVDVEAVRDSAAIPPPPPPAPKKPATKSKQPVKKTPVKEKTTTPAKKPD